MHGALLHLLTQDTSKIHAAAQEKTFELSARIMARLKKKGYDISLSGKASTKAVKRVSKAKKKK